MTWILILESRCVYIIGNIFLNRGFGDFLKVPRHNETSVTLPFKNFSSQTVPFLNAVEDLQSCHSQDPCGEVSSR